LFLFGILTFRPASLPVQHVTGNSTVFKISKAALIAAVLSLTAAPAAGLLTSTVASAAPATTNVQQGHEAASSSAEPTAPSQPETTTTGFTSSLSIPTITAVDSSMDETALRDALSGGFAKHIDEIARLNATSITIPEITLTMTITAGGADHPVTTTAHYKDILLSNVRNGVAESASVGATESNDPTASFKFGKMSMSALDFGGFLSLYSTAPAGSSDQPMKTLYRNFSFEGGSFSGPEASCTFGKIGADEFQARPLKVSFTAMMEAAQKMGAAKDATPPADAVRTFVTFLTDIFQSFKSTPLTLDGLSCSGSGSDGKPFEFKLGGITMDGYAPGIYPAISIKDVSIGSGSDSISVAAATFKSTDLSQPIKAIEDNVSSLSAEWFEKNYRRLIPAFGGFSFSGLAMDIPDTEHPGERIKANVADFDLTLSDYLNGIPTKVSSKATGVEVPLPTDSTDENVKMLLALGISKVDLGFEFAANWDRASQTASIDKMNMSAADIGSFAFASVVGNATEQLFDLDPDVQQAAGFNVALKSITVSTSDDGIGEKVVPLLAQQQGAADPTAFRTQMAGMAEGAALQILGSTDAARDLGVAVGNFISGKAKTLTINVKAKDPNGIAMPLLMQASTDPTVLASAVDITGSNPAQ
jgi:hypothetical protein